MPQLKSGRHVGVAPLPLLDRIKFGTDSEIYALVIAYRLEVQSPEDLRGLLPVTYFKEGEGTPPDAPAYALGLSVKDVLGGKADWLQAEVDEFRQWVETDAALNAWVRESFAAIHEAIVNSLLWESPLITDEPERGTPS